MMRTRRKFIAAFGTLAVGTLAGCSGDDEDTETPADTETGTDTPTETETETDTPTNTETETETSTETFTPPTDQTAKLSASDGDSYEKFGWSVAVSGDGSIALVGADADDDPNGDQAGSVYVFSRADGTWSEEAKLTAGDGDSRDHFGRSVAMSGDGSMALVGAPFDSNANGDGAGSAYVFSRADGSWSQEGKLIVEDGGSDDRFGWSVAVSGDGSMALVGAQEDEDPNGEEAGSAYVFSRADGTWSEEAKLAASDGDSDDQFGQSVAVSGDGSTALIGVVLDEDPNGERAGSAYVFSPADGTWGEKTKLSASDGDSIDNFGWSVAVSGDGSTALIGARGDEDPNGDLAGSAYVFSRADGTWSEEAKLTASDGDEDDFFGGSVAVSGDGSIALVGAYTDDDPNGEDAGSAYVFSRSGGEWSEETKLSASDGDEGDSFGSSVTVSRNGSTAFIGAWKSGEQAGSAYVFE